MMAASVSNIFGATGAASAALIAAQRLFCPSAILRRLGALSTFFLGAAATSALDVYAAVVNQKDRESRSGFRSAPQKLASSTSFSGEFIFDFVGS
jgi:hypothetical protein